MSKEHAPLVIAKSFTKRYYEVLNSKPQHLHRFYRDESNFFHGDDSQSSETSGIENIRQKIESLNLAGTKVDFTGGSIDAQRSDNNAVFLVATGKFTMPGKSARKFTQSFLVCQHAGKADSYYVRNSVFRLLDEEPVAPAFVPPPAPPVDLVTTAVFEKKEDVEVAAPQQEKVAAVQEQELPEVTSEEDDKAETTTAAVSHADELDISTVTSEPEYVNVSMKKEAPPVVVAEETAPKDVKEVIPEPVVVKEKVKPASWARLFDGGAPEPVQEAPKPKKAPAVKREAAPEKSAPASKPAAGPPLTVYICQLPETVVESDVRALFEPFGAIKKVDIHAQKGFAFVDFFEASSVQNAMAKKDTGYFNIRDSPILVEERQTKGSGMGAKGGSNRSGRGVGGNTGGNRQHGQKNGDKKQGDNKGGNNNRNRAGNKTGGNAKPSSAAK